MEIVEMEQKIREALKVDFGDYLGEYSVVITENDVTILCADPKVIQTSAPTELELPKYCWRAVAEVWLKDDTADRGETHTLKFHFHNGSIRGDQNKNFPLPPEKGDREMDVRWRLAFGKEIR